MALRIEENALIGDSRTAALVGSDDAIDWPCLPRFDPEACFASLPESLDGECDRDYRSCWLRDAAPSIASAAALSDASSAVGQDPGAGS